ncbi:nuclear transport factor 2 family protein [Brevundimonas nasdae]|uniref:Nuclear transport factor 2 family protein n=1 Tax=Brevundimonas nasdae TaxID=172043 RepID=A0ABX8THL0_9CAUL|nr:nuclear transport factor 2 family protein [Brevundimonas nasdae]QYC09285.1 nuclear transport factor 2 family protein [Brevundimonas nasdae]QYC15334.1 nuclear transport factor 2 family protein [Brevundimonas nasdae]
MTPLEALVEIEAIKQLKARYIRFGDARQWGEFAATLTEDVTFLIDAAPRASPDHNAVIEMQGRDDFIAAMEVLLQGVKAVHQASLPEITITSLTTAKGVWWMHDWVQLPSCNFKGWGHYHQEYVKVDGAWKIQRSHTTRLRVEEEWL